MNELISCLFIYLFIYLFVLCLNLTCFHGHFLTRLKTAQLIVPLIILRKIHLKTILKCTNKVCKAREKDTKACR